MNNKVAMLPALFLSVALLVVMSQLNAQSSRPAIPHVAVSLILPGNEKTGEAADGLAVYFSDDFGDDFGDEDSYKFTNLDENIGILRNGVTLSLEGRKPVRIADTLPIKMWQLLQKNYTFKIDAVHLADNVNMFFQDSYLKKNVPITNDAVTTVAFSLNNENASSAPDRFKIVFETYVALPVEISAVKAFEKNNGIQVEWKTESESNIARYEIEKSANGSDFTAAGSVNAKNAANISATYSWIDLTPNNGSNYYRIKSIDKSGEVKYSSITKTSITRPESRILAAVNPGQTNAVNLVFKNVDKGNYKLQLINMSGQKIYEGSVSHAGGTASRAVTFNSNLAFGVYQMQVLSANKTHNVSVLIH